MAAILLKQQREQIGKSLEIFYTVSMEFCGNWRAITHWRFLRHKVANHRQ